MVCADLSEIEKKGQPSPGKNVDCKVVYSDLLIKGQPPPPPPESVELKQVSNLQASVTVIPAGVKVDDSEFSNEIVEMRLPHMDNSPVACKDLDTQLEIIACDVTTGCSGCL